MKRHDLDGARQPQFGSVTIRNRGRLPHWEVEQGVYFITYRLADSLPREVLEGMKSRALRLALAPPAARTWRHLLTAVRLDRYLDRGVGTCALANAEVATMVADNLRYFEGKRYRLFAWCVMPNHVHIIARLFPGIKLDQVVQTWKSYTAHRANEIVGRVGVFWQREYYDHLIRSPRALNHAICYVANNPMRAGLVNWAWVDAHERATGA